MRNNICLTFIHFQGNSTKHFQQTDPFSVFSVTNYNKALQTLAIRYLILLIPIIFVCPFQYEASLANGFEGRIYMRVGLFLTRKLKDIRQT